MNLLESPLFANLLYLTLMAGLWIAAWAVVTPGTGFLELFAFLALALAAVGTLIMPLNVWALGLLILGAVLFVISLWRRGEIIWLGLSVVAFCVGSVFLLRMEDGGPAIHPALAIMVSVLTLGFFWFVIRETLVAHKFTVAHDPALVLGKTGQARTDLDPIGSVHVEGELWSARAEGKIRTGSYVRVIGKEGLMLTVEGIDAEG